MRRTPLRTPAELPTSARRGSPLRRGSACSNLPHALRECSACHDYGAAPPRDNCLSLSALASILAAATQVLAMIRRRSITSAVQTASLATASPLTSPALFSDLRPKISLVIARRSKCFWTSLLVLRIRISLLFSVCEFHQKRATPLAQHLLTSCLARKSFTSCFQHDPKVVCKPPSHNWPTSLEWVQFWSVFEIGVPGGLSFWKRVCISGSFSEHVGGLWSWRVEFLEVGVHFGVVFRTCRWPVELEG